MNEEWLVRLTAQHVLVQLPEAILGRFDHEQNRN